ncbi:DUF3987 domain-containing protein [Pseudoxanthomonas mexicana]
MFYPIPSLSGECPIDALPDLLLSAACEIRQLEGDVPAECLLTDAIAACVVPVQRLYDVQGLDPRRMPTTVNTLALAPSACGKGTSFQAFFESLIEHNRQAAMAAQEIRASKRRLKKAGLPIDGPEFREPDGRLLTTVSYRALAECLQGSARAVSINHEDGFSVLQSDLFTKHGEVITQAYSGLDLPYDVKGVDLLAMDPRCAFGIRLQGELFDSEMKRTRYRSLSQGIWGRSMVACFDPKRLGSRHVEMPADWPGGGLAVLHERLKSLMESADEKHSHGGLIRDKVILGEDAKAFMHELKFRLKGWRDTCYADIDTAAGRAWENTLRIAAVFQVVCEGNREIRLHMVRRAWAIVEWSLTQHQMIFAGALKQESKPVAAVRSRSFANSWPASIKSAIPPKPPKLPRPIQDAQWLLKCLETVSHGQGQALLADVVVLSGLRGARLETALAWLKHHRAVEVVGRGDGAVMRVPTNGTQRLPCNRL